MNGYQKYKKTAVQSASREKILLMLYDGAIKFMKKAIIACEKKEIAERGTNIGRAYDIVLELMNSLNHQIGGEMAASLEQLYMYVTDQLTQANITGDASHLRSAIQVMETLNDGWKKAIEKLKASGAPEHPPEK